MELNVFVEPQQGASYGDLLAVATAAEEVGFAGFFRSDHYLKMGDVSGLPGPTHAWMTLAALGRDTERLRLGTLVSPVTFYRPGPMAIMVAQADEMSGGRVELGIGTGWYAPEHPAYGLELPDLGDRFDRLEEYLEQITGLWATPAGETFSHEGRFHTFVDSPGLPKPTQQPGPPIIIGGRGPRRTPMLAARYAAELNQAFVGVDEIAPARERLEAACGEIGRDPDELDVSVALVVCLGADEATVARRAAAIGRESEELRENGLAGSADEIATKLGAYAAAGCSKAYLQILDLTDLDHVADVGSSLVTALADV